MSLIQALELIDIPYLIVAVLYEPLEISLIYHAFLEELLDVLDAQDLVVAFAYD